MKDRSKFRFVKRSFSFFFFFLEVWTALFIRRQRQSRMRHETNSSPSTRTTPKTQTIPNNPIAFFPRRGFLSVSKRKKGGSNRMYPDKLTNIGPPVQVTTRPRRDLIPPAFSSYSHFQKSGFLFIYFRNSISVQFYFYFAININTHVYIHIYT